MEKFGSVFFLPTLQANVGENKFWLADSALLKNLKLASFVLCDVSFKFLLPTQAVCLLQG